MEKITIEKIDKLANMSKLEFSQDEKIILQKEVSGIIDMLDQCGSVTVENTCEKTYQNLKHLRTDTIKEEMDIESVFSATTHAKNGYFVVPKVVD